MNDDTDLQVGIGHDDDDRPQRDPSTGSSNGYSNNQNDNGGYKSYSQNYTPPKDLYSNSIKGRKRLFYIDLKESSFGKFIKITEKSRDRKSTVMMDAEDFAPFMQILKEIERMM